MLVTSTRSPTSLPLLVLLLPCPFCEQHPAWPQAGDDAAEIGQLTRECGGVGALVDLLDEPLLSEEERQLTALVGPAVTAVTAAPERAEARADGAGGPPNHHPARALVAIVSSSAVLTASGLRGRWWATWGRATSTREPRRHVTSSKRVAATPSWYAACHASRPHPR